MRLELSVLATLCVAILAVSATADTDDTVARALGAHRFKRQRRLAHVAAGAAARQRLATENLCVDAGWGCDLNPGWVTTVPAPTTDTGKLIAYEQAAMYKCDSIEVEADCIKQSVCEWYGVSDLGICYPSPTLYNPLWLRDKEFCSGSLLDKAVVCGTNLKQAECSGECTWKTNAQLTDATKNADVDGSDSNLPQTKAKLVKYVTEYMESSMGYGDTERYGGVCTANWVWSTQLDDLANKAFKDEERGHSRAKNAKSGGLEAIR
ncbi:hypothetical protein HYH03_004955 [Edaphochlamys debaryana]|uniref:Uncharacterized protein n=1 Tax=Edaphochlamys debaryana TaxID=47281 RepID=A0A835Y8A0_9CHLO|nr:hypothetical protein HYH03_004955 [Edaphochlamys debaryana]|eukprot:KAG2496949.1 hypothetical protein HYH03_004955 [Edaphochlamys debaryana]